MTEIVIATVAIETGTVDVNAAVVVAVAGTRHAADPEVANTRRRDMSGQSVEAEGEVVVGVAKMSCRLRRQTG